MHIHVPCRYGGVKGQLGGISSLFLPCVSWESSLMAGTTWLVGAWRLVLTFYVFMVS